MKKADCNIYCQNINVQNDYENVCTVADVETLMKTFVWLSSLKR